MTILGGMDSAHHTTNETLFMILLICIDTNIHMALIDGSELDSYPLDEMDGKDAQDFDDDDPAGDAIEEIFARLGLESAAIHEPDLAEHKKFTLPVSIDRIVVLRYSE